MSIADKNEAVFHGGRPQGRGDATEAEAPQVTVCSSASRLLIQIKRSHISKGPMVSNSKRS